jgi:hypothetical protein
MVWKHSLLALVVVASLVSVLVGCEAKKKPAGGEAPPNTTGNP